MEYDTSNDKVYVRGCDSDLRQHWDFDGTFLKARQDLSKCLAINANDDSVFMLDCQPGHLADISNQQWDFSNGQLKSRFKDGMCLDYPLSHRTEVYNYYDYYYLKSVDLKVSTSRCNSGDNQQWYFKVQDPTSPCALAETPHAIAAIVCPHQTLKSSVSGSNVALYDKVKASVIDAYDSLSTVCAARNCEQGDFAGSVLRFAGHDFMDWNGPKRQGGSDGCIDFMDPDNAGLKQTLCGGGEFGRGATLNNVYKNFCSLVSYADFLVIAAEAMMIRTRPDYSSKTRTSPSLSFDFKFGRQTSVACKMTSETALPNAVEGCPAVDEVFNKRMELDDWRLSAALMGVHTLGRMRAENTGFEGWWNTGEGARLFTNDYYKTMTTGWLPKRNIGGDPKKSAWMRADDGPTTDLFLDTDLCLYQGKDTTAANAVNSCHWSIIRSGDSNDNSCKDNSYTEGRDTSLFPFAGCCSREFADGIILDTVALSALCGDADPCFLNERIFSSFGEGAATQDVVEFAKDESVWLKEFKKAWKKATENNLSR